MIVKVRSTGGTAAAEYSSDTTQDATLPITGTLTIMLVTTKVKSGY